MDDRWLLSKLYQLIGRRPRTVKEIKDWLKKREVSTDTSDQLINRLLELKLLDDEAFTHSYVRTQKLIKPQSTRQLTYKLQKKGISAELTKKVLEEEGHDEVAAAEAELRKKAWKWEGLDPRTRLNKQREFLARKGFSFDMIKKVTSE